MILTELPDLPPRPETPANAAFRRDYVARWTKENTLLCGVTQFADVRYGALSNPGVEIGTGSISRPWPFSRSAPCQTISCAGPELT